MTRTEIMAEVQEIFKAVFDDEGLMVTDETTADDVEDWDSLEQINLLVSMERRFAIKFNLEEVSKLKNVGGMTDLIESKLL